MDYESAAPRSTPGDEELLALVRERITGCDIVVVSDYAKGFLTRACCQDIIAAAHEAGRTVVVDPRPQHAEFYKGCDVLTPNWRESLGLLGIPDAGAAPEHSAEVGRQLATRFGCQVLLTLGARGMQYFGRDGALVYDEPTQAREVFDVSGAGDTVVAAFALALASGSDPAGAVALANRAAGIVVGKLGTATVSPGELLPQGGAATRLVGRDALAVLASRLRAEGKRVVTVNGSFDLLHAGHLHILREARGQGDVLIVGLNSDRSVREYKGANRPIVGQAERAEMLLALKDVDYVHIFDEAVPMPFLDEVRPDVHVNGSEYGAECIEAPTVRAHGGRIHIVDKVPGLSTSALLDRLRGVT
jgi:D-beta-D-heptose 7-phosphate kinase/D-beta-D-heptose 1-phosphate adenosyltransferase